jgi:hypothetical protein
MPNIRQLLCVGLVAGAGCVGGPAIALDTTFSAVLNGGNEVSGTGEANAGDQDGYGIGSVVFNSLHNLCHAILVNKIGTPTAAHIHRGRAGVNGPIVVTLNAPNTGSPGTSRGCGEIDGKLAVEIRANPTHFYINVHTGGFPGGAIRGQLD